MSKAQNHETDYISKIVSAMSFDQKIGQLIFFVSSVDEVPFDKLKRYFIGGVCLVERGLATGKLDKNRGDYAWGLKARNIRYPPDLEKYSKKELVKTFHKTIRGLQANASLVAMAGERVRIPLFVAGDFEGGEFPSLAWDISDIPSMMTLSQTRKCNVVFTGGEAIGAQMRALGFNMNFAPVTELHSGLPNDMMGERASSADTKVAKETVGAFYQGLKKAGVITIAKHFPGHGDATANPHFVIPTTSYSQMVIEKSLEPFLHLAKAGVDGFMSAHVNFSRLSQTLEGLPFSLHPTLLKKMKKKFSLENYLWVTDELFTMQAPAKALGYAPPFPPSAYYKLASMAVSAGHDIILIRNTQYLGEAVRALQDYFRHKPEDLNSAVQKVLILKMRLYPNFKVSIPDESQAVETIISRRKVALESSRQGIVLVRDEAGFFNPSRKTGQKIDLRRSRAVALVPDNGVFARNLVDMIREQLPVLEVKPHYFPYRTGEFTSRNVDEELSEKIEGNFYNLILKELVVARKDFKKTVLLLAFARTREASFVAKLSKKLSRKLGDSMPPTIFIALGAPNNLPVQDLAGLNFTYLAASSRNRLMLEAVAETLAGKLRPAEAESLTIKVPGALEKISPMWDSCY